MRKVIAACAAIGFACASSALTYAQFQAPFPAAEARAAKGRPGWTIDPRTGCWMWNSYPSRNDAVRWSGSCSPDGPAEGRGTAG
jgi:hypothetical protein